MKGWIFGGSDQTEAIIFSNWQQFSCLGDDGRNKYFSFHSATLVDIYQVPARDS